MSDQNLERAIGRLEGKMEQLLQAVAKSEQTSAESRLRMWEQLHAGELRMQEIENEAKAVRGDLENLKPLADTVRRWEQRGIGAAGVIAAMGAIFGGTFVAFKEKVLGLLGLGG